MPVVVRLKGFAFTRPRIIQVCVIVVLVVLGFVLAYLTLDYLNTAIEPIRDTQRLSGAADLGPACVPGFLCGVVALVVTFRSRSRPDTYGGV